MEGRRLETEESESQRHRWNVNLNSLRHIDQGTNKHEESAVDELHTRHGIQTPHFCASANYSVMNSPQTESRTQKIEPPRSADSFPFSSLFPGPREGTGAPNSLQVQMDSLFGHFFKADEGEESEIGTEADEVDDKSLEKRIGSINGTALAKKIADGLFITSKSNSSSKTIKSEFGSKDSQESVNKHVEGRLFQSGGLPYESPHLVQVQAPSLLKSSQNLNKVYIPLSDRRANSDEMIGTMDREMMSQVKQYASLNSIDPLDPSSQAKVTSHQSHHITYLKN